MTGACECERRFAVAGVDDRRDGSSRNAKRAPHAGQVIPVVPATENRAAHLGQMIVIAKSPPGLDYITRIPAKTGDGTAANQAGRLALWATIPRGLGVLAQTNDAGAGQSIMRSWFFSSFRRLTMTTPPFMTQRTP